MYNQYIVPFPDPMSLEGMFLPHEIPCSNPLTPRKLFFIPLDLAILPC
jgi:hypothetical protein